MPELPGLEDVCRRRDAFHALHHCITPDIDFWHELAIGHVLSRHRAHFFRLRFSQIPGR